MWKEFALKRLGLFQLCQQPVIWLCQWFAALAVVVGYVLNVTYFHVTCRFVVRNRGRHVRRSLLLARRRRWGSRILLSTLFLSLKGAAEAAPVFFT